MSTLIRRAPKPIVSLVALAAALLVSLVAGPARPQADRAAEPRHEDPVVQGTQEHLDRLCRAHDARAAAVKTPQQLQAEVASVRRGLLKLLDLDLGTPRKPPRVRKLETLEYPNYQIEKLILETAPGVPVPCNLYLPRHSTARMPALIVPHGHSGRDRPVYQNGYQRLAKAGFIVLARDGWGKQERRGTGHGAEGGQLFLTGTSLMSLELWDNVRCVDYLLTRSDVDGERLGMVGLSGGGTQTLFTMAIEPRLRAGSPTCAVTTLRSDLADTTMCVCELAPDVLTVADHGLILAAAYPRPLLVVNGTRDPIFPIAGARFAAAQAKQLYGAGGHAERIRFAEFDADHDWNDAMLTLQIGWFREQFGLPALPVPALGDGPIPYEKLRCFPDGDLPRDAMSLTQVNRLRMRRSGGASPVHADILRSRWSSEPRLPDPVTSREGAPDPSRLVRRDQLSWRSGLGGMVTAAVTRPFETNSEAALPVVIRLDRDRLVPQIERLYWDDRLRTHATVVDFEYTGRRLTPVVEGQISTALVASGRSLLAERARDVLVLLQVLQDRRLLREGQQVVLYGHGFDGVLLLALAPELPEGARLVLDETPISYLAGAEIDFRTSDSLAPPAHWTILPGLARQRDLSGLLPLAGSRSILLLHPQDAAQQRLTRPEARRLLREAGAPRTVELIPREAERRECLARLNDLITRPVKSSN